MNLQTRTNFSNKIADFTETDTPSITSSCAVIDYEISIGDQKWYLWKDSVPVVDIEAR
jgi:hypothetical protein